MKYVKMLGLLAIAAAALMAFAGTASADLATFPKGTEYTSTIESESEGATELHGSFVTVKCNKSKVVGKIESHGAGKAVGGKVSNLTFTECNYAVTVVTNGSLSVDALSGGTNGTVTSSGAEITIKTSIANCIFTTSNTDVGTLTSSDVTSGHATMDINSAAIPRTGHSIFCGSSGTWTGSYTVTTPSTLRIDAS